MHAGSGARRSKQESRWREIAWEAWVDEVGEVEHVAISVVLPLDLARGLRSDRTGQRLAESVQRWSGVRHDGAEAGQRERMRLRSFTASARALMALLTCFRRGRT